MPVNDQVTTAPGEITTFELLQLLDAGKKQINPNDTTTLVNIIDSHGSPVSDPVMLDGQGSARPFGPAVYLRFTQRWALDWTALNLPANITGQG